ncbi:hypothetical protein K469DRAFT_680630 [Zopfia rhizophila CBS 207.26]|uniref:Uncharacterized protein n=1 Tax=Zopfia rhizophila CBS 207.26 TaxID=1314779 RepID=A0A6A6D6F5_9PEZI|nr:hypothetical protein K469DRAFT_680630 [Zopfia rhizophila CBS 207.26]
MASQLQDELSEVDYYTGFWTNYSRGPVYGKVLTVPTSVRQLLSAFFTIYITYAGSRLWGKLATPKYLLIPSDGVYHQHQAILRNTESPLNSLWLFLRLSWAWRQHARRPWLRNAPLVVLAAIYAIACFLAGIFIPGRVIVGDEVLIQSSTCG